MIDREEVKALFTKATELPAERRDRFLRSACNGNEALRKEVESLLNSHGKAPEYFGSIAADVLPETVRKLSAEDESNSSPDAHIGTTVGSYRILELLGGGGMGVVYKARHITLDQFAAIKFLPPHLSEDPTAKQRFIFEAKAAFALDHVNICTVYDIGETSDGQLFIVMAYYEGQTLKQQIQSGSITAERTVDYASQITEGLSRAHVAGIVHRDIKPANLFVTNNGVVKILDFGVAKGTTANPLTRSGRTLGTVAYMSPEQATGSELDHRTDIWSLGVVWYEMLTGVRPFDAEYEQATVYNILNASPDSLTERGIATEIAHIVDRCLEKSPDHRYQSTQDLFADIYRLSRTTQEGPMPGVAVNSLRPTPEIPGRGVGSSTGDQARRSRRATKRANIFIGYKRDLEADAELAAALADALGHKHDVFIDTMMTVGARWVQRIEQEIANSDYFITLLSSRSVNSEMVIAEIELAHRLSMERDGSPMIIPIRIRHSREFAYPLSSYLNEINWAHWDDEEDTERLLAEINEAIESGEFSTSDSPSISPAGDDTGAIPEPLMAAQPQILESPEGTMDPQSAYYVERDEDALAMQAIARDGVTLTIKGPRQMGKSSLLLRTMMEARKVGKRVVFLDFQLFNSEALQDSDTFFRQFCTWITDELDLEDKVDEYWLRPLGNSHKCTRYVGRHILNSVNQSIVLAMDEVERVFDTSFRSDFFSMLRSWHNDRAVDPKWKRLDLALVTSTEPYQLIENLNQSPFNVGEVLSLADFTLSGVTSLNQRLGDPLKREQLSELMALVEGHPYLVRRALYLVASGRTTMDGLIRTATTEESVFGDHLRYHFFRLHNNQRLVEAMRIVVNGEQLSNEEDYWRLRGAGLVTRVGSEVKPRCRLYADYFRSRIDA